MVYKIVIMRYVKLRVLYAEVSIMKRKIALVLIAAFCVSSLMPEMQSKASEINGTEIQSQIEAESGEESNEVMKRSSNKTRIS